MRYMINVRDIELDMAMALYKTTLAWSANRGDLFVLSLQRDIYDDPDDVVRLCALGKAKTIKQGIPKEIFGRILTKIFREPSERIQVEGKLDEAFVYELTSKAAPNRAVSGDLCPVEDLMVLKGERILYASYDYGRDQILELTDEELESLQMVLKQAGLDPVFVIRAPPIITGKR